MAAKKKNALATQTNHAVATVDALDATLLADAGVGFEEAGREAYAVPFLRVLQDLSPQVKPKMSGYVKGAKPGMIFNTVSQEVYDSIRVIPCHFTQTFIEWVPRAKGGGLAAVHPATSPIVSKATRNGSRNVLPNGNELADTRSHFVLVLKEDGTYEGALIAMASTALKISRRWMSQMRSATITVGDRLVEPPMFAWSYRLGTDEEANDQGSWHTWSVSERERVTDPELYRAAKHFGQVMRGGEVRVNYEEMQTTTTDDTPTDIEDNDIDA